MLQLKSDEELIHEYVVADPHQRGLVEVRVKDFGIHVWALIGDLRAYQFDVEQVAEAHRVPIEYVQAALAYYRHNPEIIDARLAENEA